jgi:RNA polymerase sigma factor (sigma-70 family)
MDMLRKRRTTTFSEMSGVGEDNVPFDESGAMKDDELLPDEVFERAEKNNMLDEMLHKLSPEEAEILHLYFSEDMTFREVSEMLGKPLETIKSKHRRALAKLKKLLTAPKLDN